MATFEIGAFEVSAGVIAGLIMFSFTNAVGTAISEVYFKPWLKKFKGRHDKILRKGLR